MENSISSTGKPSATSIVQMTVAFIPPWQTALNRKLQFTGVVPLIALCTAVPMPFDPVPVHMAFVAMRTVVIFMVIVPGPDMKVGQIIPAALPMQVIP